METLSELITDYHLDKISPTQTNNNNILSNIANGDESPTINDFFQDAVIFVTGGTGFLGKALVEKLLRSCDGIKSIYILLRPKRGQNSEERYKEFVKNPVFDRIRSKNPDILNKLLCVSGDINLPCIGLDEVDKKKFADEVNVVFHVAATVRFNEEIRDAANLNTLGTERIMDLCSSMINLKSIVHVSTAYSNPSRKKVDEEVYPTTPLSKDSFITLLNNLPTELLSSLSDRLQGTHPNTYTLTKSMAEQIVSEYHDQLPICIVRPSIVTAAIEEPFPGWVDNVYGITGIMMEIGRGTISSIMCDEKCVMDLIPVDIVVNTLISAAWANSFEKSNSIRVYNCTSGQINPIKWNEYGNITVKYAKKNPSKYVMLYPGFSYRTNRTMHRIIELIYHFAPAYVFDMILRVQGAKPIMAKIAKRFQMAADTGEFFAMHEWNFDTKNLQELIHTTKQAKDGNEFNSDMSKMDWDSYVETYMLGIRKYVLKDELDSLPSARRKLARLFWIRTIFQIGLLCLFINLIFQRFFF